MMRTDVRTTTLGTSLKTFWRDFPLGSAQRVVVVDATGAYAGIVLVADAYSDAATDLEAKIDDLLRWRDAVLLPQMSAREAAALFDRPRARRWRWWTGRSRATSSAFSPKATRCAATARSWISGAARRPARSMRRAIGRAVMAMRFASGMERVRPAAAAGMKKESGPWMQ